jgi:WD40 repeat protein
MKKTYLLLLFQFFISLIYSQDKEGFSYFRTDCKIVYDICFTERGEALGIADNNEIKVYRTGTKDLLHTFKDGHKRQILSIDISSDSTLLASGGKDSTVVIWDFISGSVIKKISWQQGIVTSVNISPDRKYLVWGGADDNVILYDIVSGKIAGEYRNQKDDITCTAFSPSGKLFVIAGAEGIIKVYDTESHDILASLSGHTSWVRDISFSGDGKKLISCGDDSRIITWDFSDRNNIRKIAEKSNGQGWLLCADYRADGDAYAFGSSNGTIKIVFSNGNYSGHLRVPVNRILFYPGDGKLLQVAVATRGKGVMLIGGSGLKLRNK